MSDSRCFVQFLHPGREHTPDAGYHMKQWNKNRHARKFLRCPGCYVDGTRTTAGDVLFWAEWEPESLVEEEIADPVDDGPRFIYSPYYVPPSDFRGLQNTDPWVFGQFLYTGCHQHTTRRSMDRATPGERVETQLRRLSAGSVILFGSNLHGAFILDTLFVVRDSIEHDASNYQDRLRDEVPAAYWSAALDPWYRSGFDNDPPLSFRLYRGATFERPVDGMFSFFPCSTPALAPKGFARPTIEHRWLTPTQRQNFKLRRDLSIDDTKKVWESVRRQILDQGAALGISAALPPVRFRGA